MQKKILILAIISLVSIPLFAEISLDLGVSTMGHEGLADSSILGFEVNVGAALFDYKAIVQISGGLLSPPMSVDDADGMVTLGTGVLFSPIKYLYLGMRSGFAISMGDDDNWYSYGRMVFRVQNQGKGLHYYAESEISFTGVLARFSMGLNFTI